MVVNLDSRRDTDRPARRFATPTRCGTARSRISRTRRYANFVARNIKALLYKLAPAYPNLKYMVLVGDDRMIPARRIVDEALFANERLYPDIPRTTAIGAAAAGSLLPERRLLRRAAAAAVQGPRAVPAAARHRPPGRNACRDRDADQHLPGPARPQVTPTSALVTGYSFLTGPGQRCQHASCSEFGMLRRSAATVLINDTWTAADFRTSFFRPAEPRAA